MKKPYFTVQKYHSGNYILRLKYIPRIMNSYEDVIRLINEERAMLSDLIVMTEDRNQKVKYY